MAASHQGTHRHALRVGAALLLCGLATCVHIDHNISEPLRLSPAIPHVLNSNPSIPRNSLRGLKGSWGTIGAWTANPDDGTSQCLPLVSHRTHFTAEISVGTPEQKFNVVADTGSNAVIIPSCACVQNHRCDSRDRCFTGTNHSSTFSIRLSRDKKGNKDVPMIKMGFGSGDILTAIATDVVKAGTKTVTMRESLLLMMDRDLDLSGPFEGILGLGLPDSNFGAMGEGVAIVQGSPRKPDTEESLKKDLKGFMQQAQVSRFSICFTDEAGTLRLGGPKPKLQLGSIGQIHWGLDFSGVSVGNMKAPIKFCSRHSMRASQQTPCGAIPDSGTTLMLAPAEHLDILYAEICDKWPRCMASGNLVSRKQKVAAFHKLLDGCAEWLDPHDASALTELPALYFHVSGSSGDRYSIVLSAWAYVFWWEKGQCKAAFGTIDYNTARHGPVWILGTPVFYEYQVVFDLSTTPPSVSFSNETCNSCESEQTESHHTTFVARGKSKTVGRTGRAARQIVGPMRGPSIDMNSPL